MYCEENKSCNIVACASCVRYFTYVPSDIYTENFRRRARKIKFIFAVTFLYSVNKIENMSKSTEKPITFEEFAKMCRFCFKTDIILYSLFEENELEFGEYSHTEGNIEHSAHILNRSLGLEV